MPVIPAPRRLRQEDLKFKAILNYKVPPPTTKENRHKSIWKKQCRKKEAQNVPTSF
jgi:hypothetical protein